MNTSALARTLLAAFGVAILLFGKMAFAAGGLILKTADVQENAGTWHIKVRIDLPRPPSMMHTPMRFTFSKEVVDERAIMSKGAEPVHHRNVLDTPAKQIVGMDVDFADASGKVFKSTNFEFDLARKDGYFEAGEYTVSLSGPDGEVGGTAKLVLRGDNPPVYRGAMDFSDDKKTATKKKQNGPQMQNVGGDDETKKTAQNDSNDTSSSASPVSTEVQASGEAPPMVPASAGNSTADEEMVKAHPSGCGCMAAGFPSSSAAGAVLAGLGLGLVVARRRRSRRA